MDRKNLIAALFLMSAATAWAQGGAGTSGGGIFARTYECAEQQLRTRPGAADQALEGLTDSCFFTVAEAQCIIDVKKKEVFETMSFHYCTDALPY